MKLPKRLIIINILLLLISTFILFEIIFQGVLTNTDISINSIIPSIHTDFLITISKIIDFLFDTISMLILSLIIVIILLYKHKKNEAIFFALTMIASTIVTLIIKILVQRPRPLNSLILANDYAFPSGHSATAIVFFGILVYLLTENTNIKLNKFKPAIITLFAIITLIIGFSRLYLNVHWLSDVIGGFAIGGLIITTSILIERFCIKN